MVQYKLTYFPVRGLGEMARLILHYANVPFEDVRIAQDDWPNYKNKTPFGHLPVLEVDGKPLAQSFAIARFLARKHGLAGKDDFESAQIDAIADFLKDLSNECRPYFIVASGKAPGDKTQLFNDVYKPCVERNLPILEKLFNESGSGFFVKSGISWVDFYMLNTIETMEKNSPELLEKFKEMIKYKERIYSLHQLKKYFETRPDTQF